MIVIAVVNSKGGVGKTTLASALAVRAAQDSPRVAMVDLDPQCSLVEWWKRRGGTGDSPTIFQGVDSAREAVERAQLDGWDFLFLDGPPAFLVTVQEMVEAADLSLIPVKSGIVDLMATQDVIALARDAGADFLCVFNDCEPAKRGQPDQLTAKGRGYLLANGVPIADTQIAHRVSHIHGLNLGKSAAEMRDKAASDEINALWREIKAAAVKASKRKAKARKEAANV